MSNTLQQISVTILTKDAERHLQEVLMRLSSFGEVLLLDSGSTDNTLKIAASFPFVKVYTQPFLGFGPQHNRASSLATKDWILSIDADEMLSEELIQELSLLPLDSNKVYSVLRHNYFNGKWIRHSGWQRDYRSVLYDRRRTGFSLDAVHEKIVLQEGMHDVKLRSFLLHYPYHTLEDFLVKMNRYSTLFAQQNRGKRSASLGKAIFHGLWSFLRSYFLKKGFLDGCEGWIISVYNGQTAYYKYLKLWQNSGFDALK